MFVTEAIMRYCLSQCHTTSFLIQPQLESIIKDLATYYELFHSVRWNRTRKQDKAELEQKLLELAKRVYLQINTLGNSLNQYAERKPVNDVEQFNRIIQLLQEGKMLVEIHHLNGKVTPINISGSKPAVGSCIPGLEMY